jgi:sensor domain CHASE-containing protein
MSIRIISKLMIKFILPIAGFIAAVYGISYFWTNSSSKGKKTIALSLIIGLIGGISLTIYLIFD